MEVRETKDKIECLVSIGAAVGLAISSTDLRHDHRANRVECGFVVSGSNLLKTGIGASRSHAPGCDASHSRTQRFGVGRGLTGLLGL